MGKSSRALRAEKYLGGKKSPKGKHEWGEKWGDGSQGQAENLFDRAEAERGTKQLFTAKKGDYTKEIGITAMGARERVETGFSHRLNKGPKKNVVTKVRKGGP